MKDKKRSDAQKKFGNKKLDILLNKDPYQMVKELSKSFNVDKLTVSKRLKTARFIHFNQKRRKLIQIPNTNNI